MDSPTLRPLSARLGRGEQGHAKIIFFIYHKITQMRKIKRILAIFGAMTALATSVFAQNVHIPDANFKAILLNDSAINLDADSEISLQEAQNYTGHIVCSNANISDLTGIEAFVNIWSLDCARNTISSLNLSANLGLQVLYCQQNLLASLEVSGCTMLENLDCSANQLTALDVSSNLQLQYLACYRNRNLGALDVSANLNLASLLCGVCNLSALDVSQCPALWCLNCAFNNISSLDLSQNSALGSLSCLNNNLEHLDLSQNAALVELICSGNPLAYLNLANGQNGILHRMDTRSTNWDGGILCFKVDDAAYSQANWQGNLFNFSFGQTFSEDCEEAAPLSSVSRAAERVKLSLYPNPAKEAINFSLPQKGLLRVVDLLGRVLIERDLEAGEQRIDISGLPTGLYLLQVNDAAAQRFVKE